MQQYLGYTASLPVHTLNFKVHTLPVGNSHMDHYVHVWSADKSFMEINVALQKPNNLSA